MTNLMTIPQIDAREYLLSIEDSYTDQVRHYVNYLDKTGQEPTIQSLRAYVKDMIQDGTRASTIGVRLAGVKRRIRELFEMSEASHDPGERIRLREILKLIRAPKIVKVPVSQDKILSEQEYQLLLHDDETPGDIRLIIEFLMQTGARISEVLNIRLINLGEPGAKGKMPIPVLGKGNKERTLRLDPEFIERVADYFQGEEFLFERDGKRLKRQYVEMRIVRHAANVLGRHVTPHMFRHTWFTHMIEKYPEKLKAISKYGGHSKSSVTLDMYVQQTLEDDELNPFA